ncbi:MAG: glycosyltransferase family 2 protein, partial [Candidatus Paceibacterota bacterium]
NLENKGGIVGLAIDEGDRIAYAGKIEWLKPTLSHITTFKVVNTKSVDKLYAIGGAVAIHKDVFEKIGFLDEKYFLYFEDADFSVRAKKAGISVNFVPDIVVSHSVSASTKKLGSPTLLRYHYRNALYFNLWRGPWYLKFVLWIWRIIIVAKQIIKLAIGKNKEESKAILQGVFDYYRRRYGKIH